MAENVKLTAVERLILANQYEILGLLQNNESLTRLATDLKDGHAWIFESKIRNQLSDELPDASAKEVLAILGIYSDLKDSYDQLGDKSGIDGRAVVFPGYDGNNEGELLHFTAALSANGNYSQTIGEHARNSHCPVRDMYQRMVDRWTELGKPRYPLSKEAILAILDAQIHPSNRE
ncbi:YfbU family protein [Roseateles amylovorans]|uniref:YfbU family protein n=1 Tax=Roseateles amylovorans TaxID=2978473 RepID=A0ABY6B4M0_9BURK|nr:YfbU family protein [Roseateles amylovorans]UXH79992.1 YfbU family protein [Roseateles amylovorans]